MLVTTQYITRTVQAQQRVRNSNEAEEAWSGGEGVFGLVPIQPLSQVCTVRG